VEKLGHYAETLSLGEAMSAFRQRLEQDLLKCGADPEAVADTIIALNEALVNVVRHGYRQPGSVEIILFRRGGSLLIDVFDEAPLFDPTSMPAPDISAPLAQRPFGGMGVHMMREFVDELHYQATADGRNQLTLIKHHTFNQTDI
jgi:serine/threonine-protein kinase RsbW